MDAPRIPTEAEVAELVSRTGEIARGLAFQRDQLKTEVEQLRAWKQAAHEGHPNPCTLGSLCPYCEIEKAQAEIERLRAERDELADALRELHDFAAVDNYYIREQRSKRAFAAASKLLAKVEKPNLEDE